MKTIAAIRYLRGGDAVGFTLAVCSSLGVYLYTLCPSVYAGDSGELSLACLSGGVPHPPGYPLFVWLGRIFCLADAAEPAVLTNLMCAVMAALAVGAVFLILNRILHQTVVALAGGWMAGLGFTFWGQATVTEVYPSACLGVCALLLSVEAFDRTRRPGFLYLLAFLAGLCMTLHQSLVLLLPAVLSVMVPNRGRVNPWLALVLFGLGTTPYLGLMIRSWYDPVLDWGDPESPRRLISLLLRRNYGELQQNPFSAALMLAHVQAFFARLLVEIPLALLVFSLPGMYLVRKERPALCRFMLLGFLVFVFGLILVIQPSLDSARLYQLSIFYMPVYILFAVWTAAGFVQVVRLAAARASSLPRFARFLRSGVSRTSDGRSPAAVVFFFCLAAPAWLFFTNFDRNNRRDFFDARVYGENILRSLPTGATLVTSGDNETFILAYLCRALGRRADVELVHRKGHLFEAPDYIKHSSRADLQTNMVRWQREILNDRDPVYYSTWFDITATPGWRLSREGLVFRAVRSNGDDQAADRTVRLFRAYDTGVLERDPKVLEFITRKFAVGYLEGMWSMEAAREKRLLSAIGAMGYDFPEALYFVGVEKEKAGDYDGAYYAYAASARLDPASAFPWLGMERVLGRTAAPPSGQTD